MRDPLHAISNILTLCKLHRHLFRLKSSSTYFLASTPIPSDNPFGPHPAAAPPILCVCPPLPKPIAHMPLVNRLPELFVVGVVVSRARLTKKASRSSSVLNCTEEPPEWAALSTSSLLACEGGKRNQTTHHPRLVLHVHSISARLRRVLATVARIWEYTLRASTRLHSDA
jgi:hypothetical protein